MAPPMPTQFTQPWKLRSLLLAVALLLNPQQPSHFLLTTAQTPASNNPVLEAELERDILVLLYDSTEGDSWTRNQDWTSTQVHHCAWYGVTCRSRTDQSRILLRTNNRKLDQDNPEQTIESLDLSDNNLRGSIPISLLLLLPNLKTIKLSGNNIDYSKTADLESAVLGQPIDLDQPIVSNIRHVDLTYTTVGDIERIFRAGHGTTVIQTPFLANLYANSAQLSGPFPHVLTEISSLERLSLDHNALSGTLPVTVGNWRSLKYLSIADNELEGNIPQTVNQWTKLRYLLLEANRFQGSIPIGLTSSEYTPLLEQLDVSDQRPDDAPPSPLNSGLSGRIPPMDTHKRLRRVDLGTNSFTGMIPVNLLAATEELDFVVLSSNLLTGSVPSSVLNRIPPDSLLMEDNRISAINPADCPSDGYRCNAILCPPLFYEPRSGRQEEENRPCLDCPENTKYWGQTQCVLEEEPQSPSLPVSSPTSPPAPSAGASPTAPLVPTATGINERGILLDIYVTTNGAGWEQRDGWDSPDQEPDFCNWYGISCVSQQLRSVEAIRLRDASMIGQLPPSIYYLPNLKVMDMSRNPELEMTFQDIDRALNLEAMDISATKVVSLDGLSGAAATLKEFRLSDVQGLAGSPIPPDLFDLTELRQLTLDYNNIVGVLDSEIGSLRHLQVFSATDNDLTGPIPDSVSQLSFLSTLRLTSNHLSGALPPGIAELTELSVLDLSNQWSNGEDDDFSGNGRAGLRGPLPTFEGFHQLRRLDLAVNSFSGVIPSQFLADVDRESVFEYADISENSLTGSVPSSVAGLIDIFMQDNLLTGIEQLVCDSLPGELLEFGCDAVLCRPGSYNSKGRQTSFERKCDTCDAPGGAEYYGSTECFGNDSSVSPPPNDSPTVRPGNLPSSPPNGTPTEVDSSVRGALQRIYVDCGGQNWSSSSNWMDPNVNVCSWAGIRCSSDGRVIGISLRSNNLEGTFPSSQVFTDVSSLESLILDGNKVVFPFTGIASALSLATLDLSHTELDTVAGLEESQSLRNLYLSSNNLRGNFPSELVKLSGLERLAIAFNGLSGTIPEEISELTGLEYLSLSDNALRGEVPTTLGELIDLSTLLLQGNTLRGSIPTQLNFLTKLNSLDLSKQNGDGLTGNIPSFAAVTGMKRLDFSHNSLSGVFPADFLDSSSVQGFDHMDLSFNSLSGELPAVLAKFPVSSYWVTQNRISGIPSELCDPSLGGSVASYGCDAVLCQPGTYNGKGRQLTDSETCEPCNENEFFGSVICGDIPASPPTGPPINIDVGDADILGMFYDSLNGDHWIRRDNWKDASGSICSWFGVRCVSDAVQRVQYLTLGSNNLIGTLPTEVFQLPYLKSLVLDSNAIVIDFGGIEKASLLETLDLSSTGNSNIDGIERAGQLKDFHFASNGITGAFPEELCDMASLEQLQFDFNSISGPLPDCIGRLTHLKLFSFEKNELTGGIPIEIESLTNLVTLRLGRNALTGEVPNSLDELTSLAFIDISKQTDRGGPGLFGTLPSFDGLTQLRSMSLQGNSITGSVPADFLRNVDSAAIELVDLSSNALTGTLPPSLVKFSNIFLQDNQISGIAPELCVAGRGPLFDSYGCDAVLCPPTTSSPHGRQESDVVGCDSCPQAQFYGSTMCSSTTPGGNLNPSRERIILTNFYNACGGNNWDEQANWLSSTESFCNWAGIICEGGMESVTRIEFGANNVVGVPPSELFQLPHLITLSLYSNPIDSFSFDGIENAQNLQELLLDATGISSIVGIGRAPNLTTVNLRFNNLSGKFPSEIAQLTTLHTITMAYNDLTGTLPAFLENLVQLRTLLLASNHFDGSLHSANFPSSMRLLDLSENALSGTIPESFMTLVPFSAELEVDLSNNKLTGAIPLDLSRFDSLNIYLKGNQIVAIDDQLCEKSLWNDGDIGQYGCNGLLCPPGYHSPTGRHTNSGTCLKCEKTIYFGATLCETSAAMPRSPLIWQAMGLALASMTVLLGTII